MLFVYLFLTFGGQCKAVSGGIWGQHCIQSTVLPDMGGYGQIEVFKPIIPIYVLQIHAPSSLGINLMVIHVSNYQQ